MSEVHSMKLKCQNDSCTNPLPPKHDKFCGNRCRTLWHNDLQKSIRAEARRKRKAIIAEKRANGVMKPKPVVQNPYEYIFSDVRQVFHVERIDIPTQRDGFRWLYSKSQ